MGFSQEMNLDLHDVGLRGLIEDVIARYIRYGLVRSKDDSETESWRDGRDARLALDGPVLVSSISKDPQHKNPRPGEPGAVRAPRCREE